MSQSKVAVEVLQTDVSRACTLHFSPSFTRHGRTDSWSVLFHCWHAVAGRTAEKRRYDEGDPVEYHRVLSLPDLGLERVLQDYMRLCMYQMPLSTRECLEAFLQFRICKDGLAGSRTSPALSPGISLLWVSSCGGMAFPTTFTGRFRGSLPVVWLGRRTPGP